MYAGVKLNHTLRFQNTGEALLVVERVTCATRVKAQWPDYPILPGESGEITLVYDTSGQKGEDELTVNIIANTERGVHDARIRAFVQ